MMSQERMTLYHSTTEKAFDAIRGDERLFGYERIRPYDRYSGESNLTDDKEISLLFITVYRGGENYQVVKGPPALCLLKFSIPKEEVKFVGETHIFHCDEYACTLTVDADELSDRYLRNLHAGMHQMTRERARHLQEQGILRFYQVPLDYLTSVEPV